MMRTFLHHLCQFLSRNIAVWGAENDVDLFADEKWNRRVSKPEYWLAPSNTSRH